MALQEINFIRPEEVFTPSTEKARVRYKGYNGTERDIELADNLEGDVSEVINDTFMANADGNVAFTDSDNVSHELLTAQGLGKAQVIATTWSALKALRDGGNLVAGSLYRITDYVTTTTQENTQSAGHEFDVVVLALSGDTLSEDAWAMLHDGDTYFANSNLSAWKVWYCLDNDTARFAWADNRNYLITTNDSNNIKYYRNAGEDIVESGLYAWIGFFDDSDIYLYTKVETPNTGDKLYDDVGDEAGLNVKLVSNDGRGVIYRMIDEFCNDLPYDFKNIQFPIPLTSGVYDSSSETSEYVYTFSTTVENGACEDLSLEVGIVKHNKIDGYIDGNGRVLPFNIFYQNGEDAPLFESLIFGAGSYSNIILTISSWSSFGSAGECVITGVNAYTNLGYINGVELTETNSEKLYINGVEVAVVQGE